MDLHQNSTETSFTDDETENKTPQNTAEELHKQAQNQAQRHLSFSVENILAPGRFGNHQHEFSSHLSQYDDGKFLNNTVYPRI